MALAEHEITPQEIAQSVTVRLTEAQVATLRQAAATQGQSVGRIYPFGFSPHGGRHFEPCFLHAPVCQA